MSSKNILRKPNEKKKFKGTGWKIIFYSKAFRRVKDTRVPNGKIAGTGATQADIGSIAKSARFDSDGNWRLQVYEVPMAEIDKKTQSSVLSAGMVVPTRGPGYQSYKVTAVTASAAQVTPAPAPAPAPSGGEVEEDEDDE